MTISLGLQADSASTLTTGATVHAGELPGGDTGSGLGSLSGLFGSS